MTCKKSKRKPAVKRNNEITRVCVCVHSDIDIFYNISYLYGYSFYSKFVKNLSVVNNEKC